jgi:regulator of protease activity HflC (stomatin/prohibitin superfamily)
VLVDVAFGWLGQIFEALLQFVPRIVIVRNTHQAVKWKRGGRVVAIERGRRTWYWPFLTDIEVIVVARRPANIESVSLMTADREQVAVGAVTVYHINDVKLAIGERNWDVESTIVEITQAAVVVEIMKRQLDELLAEIAEGPEGNFTKELTQSCRQQLKKYGVHVDRVGLTEFTTAKVNRVIGNAQFVPFEEE